MHASRFSPSRRLVAAAGVALLPLLASVAPVNGETVMLRSAGQCGSGYLCVWSGPDYSGTIQRFSASGYRSIKLTRVGSVYNHRADRAFVHERSDGGGIRACYSPGEKDAEVSGWVRYAEAVYLSTAENC
jgi:hypothetical protein